MSCRRGGQPAGTGTGAGPWQTPARPGDVDLEEAIVMRVRDIMSRPVHTVRVTDRIDVAAALLSTHNITAAPVVDAGALVGMVSEGDLLRQRVSSDPTAHQLR